MALTPAYEDWLVLFLFFLLRNRSTGLAEAAETLLSNQFESLRTSEHSKPANQSNSYFIRRGQNLTLSREHYHHFPDLLTRLLLVSKPVYYHSCSRISHHPTFLPVGDGTCPLEPGISDDNAEDH